MRRYVVGITGASGSIYGIRLIQELVNRGCYVDVVVSDTGKQVISYETGKSIEVWIQDLDCDKKQIEVHDQNNLFSSIASGSVNIDGMVIVPCSMSTVGEIATGTSKHLMGRAADVCMKERRKLIIVPRETPLSTLHLKNLHTLSTYGVIVLPAVPAFYHHPKTIEEMIDFVVGRILSMIGISNQLFHPWSGK